MASEELERFYREAHDALADFVVGPRATPVGAHVVFRRVGLRHRISAAQRLRTPRLTRAEVEEQNWHAVERRQGVTWRATGGPPPERLKEAPGAQGGASARPGPRKGPRPPHFFDHPRGGAFGE